MDFSAQPVQRPLPTDPYDFAIPNVEQPSYVHEQAPMQGPVNRWLEPLAGLAGVQAPPPQYGTTTGDQFGTALVAALAHTIGQRQLQAQQARAAQNAYQMQQAAERNAENLKASQSQAAFLREKQLKTYESDLRRQELAAKPSAEADMATQTANAYALAKARAEGTKAGGGGVGVQPGVDDIANSVADAIENGNQPPDLKGLYRYGGPVRAALAKRGYDFTKANLDWSASQRWLSSANGTQQLRLRQSAETAYHSLDVVDQLSAQLSQAIPRGSVKVLNRAVLNLAKNGAFGVQAQQVATNLDAQITDIVSELGNVYMGGNSPTDHALQLAQKNLSADWSLPQLQSATDLARKNLRIRLNSISTSGVMSPSNPIQETPAGSINIGGRVVPLGTEIPAPDTLKKVNKTPPKGGW